MGFEIVRDGMGRNNAFRILPKQFPLPDDGTLTEVVVRFYPENRKWNESTEPFVVHTPEAKTLPNGTVRLGERVLFHETAHPAAGDVVVEIEIDGKQIHLDKAKYKQSQDLGVLRCSNGWFIDQVEGSLR
ncbi:hypothetical protein [Cognatiluteimonas profundi]|uniref:hypothetical protein n=1 Tax=Cognatiluteimonas profundi TaxID=2594501 RepID=UPI001E379C76|nr:hypothetical protein [Lysobacter profundi]